jgi:hypothetical protein
MSWLHFLLWIAGIYTLYYLVNILYDVSFGGRNSAVKTTTNELSFTETHQPQKLEHSSTADTLAAKPAEATHSGVNSKAKKDPEIIDSRGVTLKNLFNLAMEESIIYTKAVSF